MQGGNGVLLRPGLVKKIYFPREYISLSYILTMLLTSIVSFLVFYIVFAIYGLVPKWPTLLFPVILAITLILVVGVSLVLVAILIRVEDLRYLWQLVITLGLFASPVVYDASVVPAQYAFWYSLNPMVGILGASREVLIYGVWPSAWSLVYPTLVGLSVLSLGLLIFRRSEHLFAERL
jgi:ABC-type polysaccharide/polyol phosphate export permease